MSKVIFQIEGGDPVTIECNLGDNLLEAARRANVAIDAPCSGNGSCGKCRVKLTEGTLDSLQSRHISQEEWDEGWRLSCCSKVNGNCTVLVPDLPAPTSPGEDRRPQQPQGDRHFQKHGSQSACQRHSVYKQLPQRRDLHDGAEPGRHHAGHRAPDLGGGGSAGRSKGGGSLLRDGQAGGDPPGIRVEGLCQGQSWQGALSAAWKFAIPRIPASSAAPSISVPPRWPWF